MKQTKTQIQTIEFIQKFYMDKGYFPTLKDICKKFNLSSVASAFDRLRRIKKAKHRCPVCNQKIK